MSMCSFHAGNSRATEELLARAHDGDREILGELFSRHGARLERMVRLRMDRRLQGRIDAADVLQEAYLEALKSFSSYLARPETSFFVWLRCVTARTLLDLHRYHLGAQARDARREVSLHRALPVGGSPQATSEALAARLLGRFTSPSVAARRAERRLRLESVLNSMDPMDREILTLRHLEQLSNGEAAELLGISETATSKRHVRALKKLKEILYARGDPSSW